MIAITCFASDLTDTAGSMLELPGLHRNGRCGRRSTIVVLQAWSLKSPEQR